MKKQFIFGGVAIASLLITGTVFAEEATSTTGSVDMGTEVTTGLPPKPRQLPPKPRPVLDARKELRDTRREDFEEIKDVRQENRGEIKDLREDALNGSPEDRKKALEAIKEKRQENRGELKDKREEVRGDLKEKREELKNELKQRFVVRLDALVERLQKLSDRIQSKIDEKIADGKDMSSTQALLDQANTAIDALAAKVSTLVIVQPTDQASMDANKAAMDEIKTLAKAARDALLKATYDLKANVK